MKKLTMAWLQSSRLRSITAAAFVLLASCEKDTGVEVDPTPLPPTGLFVLPHSDGIALTWVDKSSNETTFELEFARGTGDYALLASLPANQTTYTHTDIQPPLYHKYRVRACNAQGCSPYSAENGRKAEYKPAAPEITSVAMTQPFVTQVGVNVFTLTGATLTRLHHEYAPTSQGFDNAARTEAFVLDIRYDSDGYLIPTFQSRTLSVEPGVAYSLRVIATNGIGADTSEVITFVARTN